MGATVSRGDSSRRPSHKAATKDPWLDCGAMCGRPLSSGFVIECLQEAYYSVPNTGKISGLLEALTIEAPRIVSSDGQSATSNFRQRRHDFYIAKAGEFP
jgi:hypothetical protein